MKNKTILKFVLFVLVIAVISILLFAPLLKLFANRTELRSLVRGSGILGPFILMLLVCLQVVIVPLPGQLAGFASGFLYGTLLGTAYTMVGALFGTFLVFWLSRRYGRPFVEFVVDKETLEKYDAKINSSKGLMLLFMIFLLPAFPDDLICYIAGLTKIRMRTLLLVSGVGRLPGFIVLNMVGAGVAQQNSLVSIVIFSVSIIVSVVIYLFREPVQHLLAKRCGKWCGFKTE